eukprot:8908729-Pyramimonas_sp.AAC.1
MLSPAVATMRQLEGSRPRSPASRLGRIRLHCAFLISTPHQGERHTSLCRPSRARKTCSFVHGGERRGLRDEI